MNISSVEQPLIDLIVITGGLMWKKYKSVSVIAYLFVWILYYFLRYFAVCSWCMPKGNFTDHNLCYYVKQNKWPLCVYVGLWFNDLLHELNFNSNFNRWLCLISHQVIHGTVDCMNTVCHKAPSLIIVMNEILLHCVSYSHKMFPFFILVEHNSND